ncbi:MAG TPA: hypothetical protein VJI32_05105 [Candidatus Nanoarchaeia archaeon]|nr:hypothetical protein [Candidatus Nanoarchaeia archaeon]
MKRFTKLALIILIAFIFSSIFFGVIYAYGSTVAQDPRVQWVSHTEYWNSTGEVSTIVRLTDYKGKEFDIGSCFVTIYYPDKSIYVDNGELSQSPISGNWYRADPHPTKTGTYEQEVTCFYDNEKTVTTSQSFHVSEGLSEVKFISDQVVSLSNARLTLIGLVENSSEAIIENISLAETNLKELLNNVNESLSTAMEGQTSIIIKEVNLTLETRLGSLEDELVVRLNIFNTSTAILINRLEESISAEMSGRFDALDATLARLESNMTALMASTMEQDISTLNERLDSINMELSVLKEYCGEDTSSSSLCQSVATIESTLVALSEDNHNYLQSINSTATSSFALLSGDIAVGINSILSDVGVIKSQTAEINQTLNEWKSEEEDRVFIQVIS